MAQGRATLTWRNMAFLGQESVWAAEAAECAGDQGRFWDYHDLLFQRQAGENSGAFSKDNLERFAAGLGLDGQAFNACLDSDRYLARVQAETQAGRDKGVTSTPTLFVNGTKQVGAPSFQQLRALVEAAAANATPAEVSPSATHTGP